MILIKTFGPILAAIVLLVARPADAAPSPANACTNASIPGPIMAILEFAAGEREGMKFVEIAVLTARAQPDHGAAIFAVARCLEPGADAALTVAAADFSRVRRNSVATAGSEAASPDGAARPDDAGFLSLGAWDGGIELGLSLSSGNTREQAFALGLELKRVISEHWDHKLEFDLDYARRLGLTSKERYRGLYQLFYRGWERRYLYSFVAGERDRFSAFEYRITESFGAGYQILDGPRQKWSLEGGPGLRQTKLSTISLNGTTTIGGGFGNEFIAVLNSDYELQLTEGLSFSNKTRIFVGEERTTVANETALKARFNGALSARLSLDVKYDSEVLAGTHNTDTLTRATIVYDF